MTERAEHDFALAFGDIVHDADKKRWVFIGWRHNTAGAFPIFAKEQLGEIALDGWTNSIWTYYAAMTETLLRKFPELERYRKQYEQN